MWLSKYIIKVLNTIKEHQTVDRGRSCKGEKMERKSKFSCIQVFLESTWKCVLLLALYIAVFGSYSFFLWLCDNTEKRLYREVSTNKAKEGEQ